MNNESDVQIEEQKIDDVAEETTPEAPKLPPETLDQKRARLKRELKRTEQKLGITEEEIEKPAIKPFTLDRADKAFLNANGIKGTDEYELVSDFARNTGKDIEEIIDSNYFQTQLKDVRDYRNSKRASDAASGSPRGSNSASDTVEYWIAKGQLPPAHQSQLRREVVNAKLQASTNGNKFSETPVVGA